MEEKFGNQDRTEIYTEVERAVGEQLKLLLAIVLMLKTIALLDTSRTNSIANSIASLEKKSTQTLEKIDRHNESVLFRFESPHQEKSVALRVNLVRFLLPSRSFSELMLARYWSNGYVYILNEARMDLYSVSLGKKEQNSSNMTPSVLQ